MSQDWDMSACLRCTPPQRGLGMIGIYCICMYVCMYVYIYMYTLHTVEFQFIATSNSRDIEDTGRHRLHAVKSGLGFIIQYQD